MCSVKQLLAQELGAAAAWGVAAFDSLLPFLNRRALERTKKLVSSPRSVIVAAFPYYSGSQNGNLSRYARGEDYHRVLSRRLEQVCASLRAAEPTHSFSALADISPLPEVRAAQLAGVGKRGYNGLIFVPPYGSYVFLGTILTDLPLSAHAGPTAAIDCLGCRACLHACPAGAISLLDGLPVMDAARCYSALTQRRGTLSAEESAAIRSLPTIWGCDLCQTACPMNQSASISPIDDLAGRGQTPLLTTLTEDMLAGLDEPAFQVRYGDRAFAWRGIKVLRRNLQLQRGGGAGNPL